MADTIHCARGCTWSGINRAHCGACHATFGSVSGFDKHRRGDRCYHPSVVGMELRLVNPRGQEGAVSWTYWVAPNTTYAPGDSDGPTDAGQG